MSAKGQGDPGEDLASRVGAESPCSDMKRAAAKKLIERYFYQLIDGCGNPSCDNQYCASSGKVTNLTANEAAAQAISLFSQDARLCDGVQPSKVARTTLEPGPASLAKSLPNKNVNPTCSVEGKAVPYLTETKLLDIINKCKSDGSYSLLIRTLGEVFLSAQALSLSFQKSEKDDSPLTALLDRAPASLLCPPGDLSKEAVRSLQGEDKEEDSSDPTPTVPQLDDTSVDLPAVRRAFAALWSLPGEAFESALLHALVILADTIEIHLRISSVHNADSTDTLLNVFLIVFEIPALESPEYLEQALHMLCKAASCLPIAAQAKLARIWARHCKSRLPSLLQALQQLITVKVIGGSFTRDYCVQDTDTITAPTKVMKILYYASILAGELDSPDLAHDEDGEANSSEKPSQRTVTPQDPLAVELAISSLDARIPLIPFTDFYNEPLSDAVEMDKDFAYYKSEQPMKFSFMNYAFILTPATKSLGLYYDNRIRMYNERRMSFLQTVVGQPTNPYLRLKVRRDHLIEDALVELEVVAMENPYDLKKQLVVEFEGEQGVDEGGVSKEFFQLVVEEIFNPDYGMFTTQEDTQTMWFNPTSFESDAQFTLIGVVLGLAIYNNVILDVRFPMVVYRKLLGRKGSFSDLEDWNPTLYRTMMEMLEYTGDDMSDTFMQTFKVGYKDVFGSLLFHELKEKGDEIYVTQENKREFVDLYADFLLNQSVERQFKAFRRGFQMVTDESPLALLFRPEEIEQLVCGSKIFDFAELEAATEYEGGYSVESEAIRNFWQVVHSLTPEDQRRLLQFTTGSDRVPVGGLSRLKMVIARHGPDSDRLPIAHTCFNVLLLPDYSTIEKLQDRLLKAINYSKGFGML
ncbi:ubiquitin-protein ligase E3A isoform X1 [Nasonia vitripennis]|uniref:Ubiquitin-protein ligase E3A n=2 Tax=Nasonia vitripennis TaxID=7425 RepID=A0A7M7H7B4_NASVI|nr:ubiquitin-protein ligase E3A isoform X1 [Nasonia vitripennis]XP_008203544.1 ubiquitin-protein ligase E3A isoform X1 [Nasonia vitripennis]XP_008203546.1 ubiquitin-protein ligase E3A isoform X1 [Nasonia vitripennis]XP_032453896.1 ubiquitin-protein ligase E3A isoform X1 [Nasonia vitripennis]